MYAFYQINAQKHKHVKYVIFTLFAFKEDKEEIKLNDVTYIGK